MMIGRVSRQVSIPQIKARTLINLTLELLKSEQLGLTMKTKPDGLPYHLLLYS